ncbi:hypothetical protein EV360DRAFT_76516, partial [Lentinula raphanica]
LSNEALDCTLHILINAMLDELEYLMEGFSGRKAHVQCFTHTLNLTAKGVLQPFESIKPKKTTNTGEADVPGEHAAPENIGLDELYAELKNIEEFGEQDKDNIEGFVAVLDEMTEEERERWQCEVEPVKSALYKTWKISFKIINSPTMLLSKWREQLADTPFAGRTLHRDVATQWNSTHNMLECFLELKEPVMEFLDRARNGLTEYSLTDEEWEVVKDLVSGLQILNDATTFFSANSVNISSVIPAMDAIDEVFATGVLNEENLSEPIRHALTRDVHEWQVLTREKK